MDKIDFARLAAFFAHCSGRMLTYEELRDLDAIMSVTPQGRANPGSVNMLMQLMSRGDSKIEAIKEYRSLTGCTLKDSKDAVEAYWPALSEHAA
jgi:ribosomal protein L7/L12